MRKWKVEFIQTMDGVTSVREFITYALFLRDALSEFDRMSFCNSRAIAVTLIGDSTGVKNHA